MRISAWIAWTVFLVSCLLVDTIPWWASVGSAFFVGTVFAIAIAAADDR